MNNSPFDFINNDTVRIALVGALSILAIFLLAETISLAQGFGRSGVPATDTITIDSDGQATLAPDVAHVSFSVENTAATVADAQAATTKQANAAIDYVKSQNVSDKDVRTLSYNISPQYSYPNPCPAGSLCPTYSNNSPKITGYQVSETVQVTVRNLTAVGTLLSGLGKLQVQNVNGPDFALDDPTSGYAAARADAIAKARVQASLLAQQLGVKLGKIVNFNESSGGYRPQTMYAAGLSAKDSNATPNVPVGQNTYNASVSVTYEIR